MCLTIETEKISKKKLCYDRGENNFFLLLGAYLKNLLKLLQITDTIKDEIFKYVKVLAARLKWNSVYASLYKTYIKDFHTIIDDSCWILHTVIISMVFKANWSSVKVVRLHFRRATLNSIALIQHDYFAKFAWQDISDRKRKKQLKNFEFYFFTYVELLFYNAGEYFTTFCTP